MLKKLIKYDMIYEYKVLIIFYILAIVFAFITRCLMNVDTTVGNVLHAISSGITWSMIANILINNILRLWARFKINLYGDESYLSHTLPVSKNTLYNAKFLTSIITMVFSMIATFITLFIAYYSKENLESIKVTFNIIASSYDSTVVNFIIICLVVFFLEMTFLLECGYTGLILGHRKNNNRIGFSIIYGFIFYMLCQCLIVGVMYIIGMFNSDVLTLFNSSKDVDITVIKGVMWFSIAMYIILIGIDYIFNLKMFNKGVNVE